MFDQTYPGGGLKNSTDGAEACTSYEHLDSCKKYIPFR